MLLQQVKTAREARKEEFQDLPWQVRVNVLRYNLAFVEKSYIGNDRAKAEKNTDHPITRPQVTMFAKPDQVCSRSAKCLHRPEHST